MSLFSPTKGNLFCSILLTIWPRCLTLRQNCPLLSQQLQLPKAPWLVVKLLVQLFSLGLGLPWFTPLFSCWHCSELTCATSLLCAEDIVFLELSIGSGIYTLSSFPAVIPEPQGQGIVVYKVPVRVDYSAVFGSLQLGQFVGLCADDHLLKIKASLTRVQRLIYL